NDGACRVEQDLHVDWLAGVGRHVGYVDALEGVAVHSADTIGQGAYLVFAFGRGDMCGARKELFDALLLGLVLLCLQRQAGEHKEYCDQQTLPPIATDYRRTTQGLHITPLPAEMFEAW